MESDMKQSRAKAIKRFCYDCSGESKQTVTLCCCFDCSLWPWRLGVSMSSAIYRSRIEKALKNHREEVAALSDAGVDLSKFTLKSPYSKHRRRKHAPVNVMNGEAVRDVIPVTN